MASYYLPKFDCQNLSSWMYQIQQFFNHYDTPDYHRYMVASYHMEGESLTWLEEMELRGVFTNLTDWNSFVKLIQIRFGHPAKDPSCQKNLPEKQQQPKTTAPPKINPSVEPLPKPTTPTTPPKFPPCSPITQPLHQSQYPPQNLKAQQPSS
jgi:hypothetical protein